VTFPPQFGAPKTLRPVADIPSCATACNGFLFEMEQIVLEPEPESKILDAWSWSWSPKFVFRLHSPGSNYCKSCPWILSARFLKQVANWSA